MLSDTLQNDFRLLLRAIAPEIPQVYIIDAADLQNTLPRASGCLAWQADFDIGLRDWLIRNGEWRGIQPIVCLDVESIKRAAAEVPYTWRTLAHQVLIHEIAHAVPYADCGGRDIRREPSNEQLERSRKLYAEWAANPTTPLPWSQHGEWFTRAALHARHRAIEAGFDIPLDDGLCAGWRYAMSPAWVYADELGDEPERMMVATFAEIQATPAPAGFTQLFETNKFNYHHFQQKRELCQAS